jgi:hypothetical protein
MSSNETQSDKGMRNGGGGGESGKKPTHEPRMDPQQSDDETKMNLWGSNMKVRINCKIFNIYEIEVLCIPMYMCRTKKLDKSSDCGTPSNLSIHEDYRCSSNWVVQGG